MTRNLIYTITTLLLLVLVNACRDDKDVDFDNKVFNTSAKSETIILKSGLKDVEQIIKASIAKPVDYEVKITYKADLSLVNKYNESFYDNAIALPEGHYEISVPTVTIPVGAVTTPDVVVKIKKLDELDDELIYVLPVTIGDANLGILNSANTTYYVIKAGALINVVADIEGNYIEMKNWNDPTAVNNLPQMTMEALIRVRDFEKEISTVMGIEGYFLIRLGDSGFPNNQIQIATGPGNFPDKNKIAGLPANKWVHIALTYDSSDGKITLYVNGKYQIHKNINLGALNFAKTGDRGFYMGYSYNSERDMRGDIAECRIWNIVRTPEEIAANPYYVDPSAPGLVAYWKFDEGSGSIVHDRTSHENHMEANKSLKWTEVVLPEPK